MADAIANSLITGLGAWGEIGILAGVVVATVALTELVTNNAAAVLMFPIAAALAELAGAELAKRAGGEDGSGDAHRLDAAILAG